MKCSMFEFGLLTAGHFVLSDVGSDQILHPGPHVHWKLWKPSPVASKTPGAAVEGQALLVGEAVWKPSRTGH